MYALSSRMTGETWASDFVLMRSTVQAVQNVQEVYNYGKQKQPKV
jgi:hypothetical protein